MNNFRKLAISMALSLACLAQPASAAKTVEDIPFTDDFDTCTGETISMTGNQHLVNRTTQDSHGRMHYGFHRTTDAVGYSTRDGEKFRLHDEVNRTNIEFAPGQPKLLIERYVSTLKRKGNAIAKDDSYVYMRSKTVWNSNGDIVSTVEVERAVCR